MARRSLEPTELMKWRLNQGIQTREVMEKTGLPQSAVYRIERGYPMSRIKASQYLKYWGGDLNNLQMFPPELKIIDEGWSVRISLEHTNE